MSWLFDADPDHATSPSSATPAVLSFWAWVKVDIDAMSVDAFIMCENNNRISVRFENSASYDDLYIQRSGLSGEVVVDLSAVGFDPDDTWLFFGIAFSADTTVDRVVIGSESVEADEVSFSNNLSGTAFHAANTKLIGGNPNDSDRVLEGLVHSCGFHTSALSLSDFQTAWADFDVSTSADWTFLLDDTSSPWSVTAQSGSGTLTADTSETSYDSDAPNPSTSLDATETSVAGQILFGATSSDFSTETAFVSSAGQVLFGTTSAAVESGSTVVSVARAFVFGATTAAQSAVDGVVGAARRLFLLLGIGSR